jgi:hypothetical protein
MMTKLPEYIQIQVSDTGLELYLRFEVHLRQIQIQLGFGV